MYKLVLYRLIIGIYKQKHRKYQWQTQFKYTLFSVLFDLIYENCPFANIHRMFFFVEILILLVNYDEMYFERYVNAELIEYKPSVEAVVIYI